MRRFLLDTSFVIDLFNEVAAAAEGPAVAWLRRNPRGELWISPVTYAEVLEGADRPTVVRAWLRRYRWQGIGQAQAERVAVGQRRSDRRMGENDAWQIAIADAMEATIVGHDPRAFARLGERYQDHRDG